MNDYKYSDEQKDKTEEIQKWENELFRQANVILGHCTDSRYLNSANNWLAELYCSMGDYIKAKECAEKISIFDPLEEGGDLLATIYYSSNSYRRSDTLLPILAWKAFDPIRDTNRFKAILADAEAFEKGK